MVETDRVRQPKTERPDAENTFLLSTLQGSCLDPKGQHPGYDDDEDDDNNDDHDDDDDDDDDDDYEENSLCAEPEKEKTETEQTGDTNMTDRASHSFFLSSLSFSVFLLCHLFSGFSLKQSKLGMQT